MLLMVGMLPQVGAATSGCMVFFTASSNVAHYLANGVLSPDLGYVGTFFLVGFASALLGRLLAIRLVRQFAHPSLIAFVLAALLAGAAALLAAQVARQKPDFSFAPISCR